MILRAAVFLVALSGCAFNPDTTQSAFYDLDPRREKTESSPRIEALLLIEPVYAPSWLDSDAIVYRLAYSQDSRYQSYAHSHWVGPPADLLTARLAGKLAGAARKGVVRAGQRIPVDYSLRVELIEFVHVFDSPQTSQGIVELRASLIDRNPRTLLSQKSFTVVKPARSPDASGAVQALSDASDAAIAEIVEWVAQTLENQDSGLRTQD
jgi:cholesterol transport system auxiliary component